MSHNSPLLLATGCNAVEGRHIVLGELLRSGKRASQVARDARGRDRLREDDDTLRHCIYTCPLTRREIIITGKGVSYGDSPGECPRAVRRASPRARRRSRPSGWASSSSRAASTPAGRCSLISNNRSACAEGCTGEARAAPRHQ